MPWFLIRSAAATLAVAALALAAAPARSWSGEPSADYPLGPARARAWVANENRSSVVEAINTERLRHGLPPLRQHPALRDAAQAHANYLNRHGQVSHQQNPQLAGFSGVRPFQRAQAAGYRSELPQSVNELFVVGVTDVQAALMHLLSGPYHRHALLWAQANEVGIGLSAQPGLVISLGSRDPRAADAGPRWILYPPPGARQVPGLACCERPRPAGLDEFGMPVSVQTHDGLKLEIEHFELFSASGERVETALLTQDTDGWLHLAPHVAYLLPLQPLASGQRYQVRLRARAGGERLERDWHFDTSAP